MKILYYNWIQFDKKNNFGGGVNVYQKNLIEEMIKDEKNEIYFLSSGIYYNLFKKKSYIKETKNIYGEKCRTFKIYNSTITAPAKIMAKDIENYLSDIKCYDLLKDFIEQYGQFDVIHFNNIEGLSLNCLKLKKQFPNTKFIYSIHNYFPFCPQVNLFFDEKENCIDYNCGNKCVQCTRNFPNKKESILYYKLDTLIEKLNMQKQSEKIKIMLKRIKAKVIKKKEKSKQPGKEMNNNLFVEFRKQNVEALNENFDAILAVSNRVRDIAIKMGVDENLVQTNYIGTKFANNALGHKNHKVTSDSINLIYLGYFDKIKGFDFLIDSLEKITDEYAKKINFYCYARIKSESDKQKAQRVNSLKDKFLNVHYFNGYTHDELPEILSKADLGVIPVIWEDNLPQVAIELVASGVPILTSNLGGAHELFSDNDFVFEANNYDDFVLKLKNIIDNKNKLNEFFENTNKLTTMDEHINKIKSYYKQGI